MSRGNTQRKVRIADDLWQRAQQLAYSRGTNPAEIMRDALARYVDTETDPAEIVKHSEHAIYLADPDPGVLDVLRWAEQRGLGVLFVKHGDDGAVGDQQFDSLVTFTFAADRVIG